MKTMNFYSIITLVVFCITLTSCEEDTSNTCAGNYNYLENKSWLHNVDQQIDGIPLSYIERHVKLFQKTNHYLYVFTYYNRGEFRYKIFDCNGNQIEEDKTELEFALLESYGFLEKYDLDEVIVTF